MIGYILIKFNQSFNTEMSTVFFVALQMTSKQNRFQVYDYSVDRVTIFKGILDESDKSDRKIHFL